VTPQSDEDEVWRQIVASYNDTAEQDSAEQPWPDSENIAEPARRVVRPPEFAELDLEDADDDPVEAEDDEGHYTPEPPPPLPKVGMSTKLAWVALFGGPAYLLVAAIARWNLQGWTLFAAVAAFVGGFVALVVRMGDGPPNDSGWDDGAVL
jgi:hypothetical protein